MVRKERNTKHTEILHGRHQKDEWIVRGCIATTAVTSLTAAFLMATNYSLSDVLLGNVNWSIENLTDQVLSSVRNMASALIYSALLIWGIHGGLMQEHGEMMEKNPDVIPLTKDNKPDVYDMIVEMSEKEGLAEVPRMYILKSHKGAMFPPGIVNAAAAGRSTNGMVMVTDNIDRELSPSQVRGVIAHEIEHISRNHTYKGAMQKILALPVQLMIFGQALLGIVAAVTFGLVNVDVTGASTDHQALMGIFVLNMVLGAALSRSCERQADRGASYQTANPWALATGLEHIVELAKARVVGKGMDPEKGLITRILQALLSTHPPVEYRARVLRNTHFPALVEKYGQAELDQIRADFNQELKEFRAGKEKHKEKMLTGSEALADLFKQMRKRGIRFIPGL